MKKFWLAALAALAVTSAQAADMPRKALLPAPVVFSWNGLYVGGFIGGAWANNHASVTDPCFVGAACAATGSYNAVGPAVFNLDSSVIGGVTVGYNWQSAQIVYGVEAEAGYLRVRGTSLFPTAPVGGDTSAQVTIGDWYGVLAARVGVAFNRILVYAKAGIAVSDVRGGVVDACVGGICGPGLINTLATDTVWGGAFGGGIEWAFANNWTVKGEYLYLGFENTQTTVAGAGGALAGLAYRSITNSPAVHTGKLGVNYRF